MKRKTFYEAPEAELILVRFEENFCTSPVDGLPTSTVTTVEDPWDEE